MTKWVWKGIKTGIKTSKYPNENDNNTGISHGRPVDTQFGREQDASAVVKRCPADALCRFRNTVMVNRKKCIQCFKCRRKSFSEYDSVLPEQSNAELKNPAETDSEQDISRFCNQQNITATDAVINWEKNYEWAELNENGTPLPGSSFSNSINIKIVDAGACGACMNEIKQINNPYYNIHRLGFFITPTPRMADILIVAGPVTKHMAESLEKTWLAMPSPKKVIAMGTCAVSGGVFETNFAVKGGVENVIPVDIIIPGCPPPPLAVIHALLLAAGRKNYTEPANQCRSSDHNNIQQQEAKI